MQFWKKVFPMYMNFTPFSKDLLMLGWYYPLSWWWQMIIHILIFYAFSSRQTTLLVTHTAFVFFLWYSSFIPISIININQKMTCLIPFQSLIALQESQRATTLNYFLLWVILYRKSVNTFTYAHNTFLQISFKYNLISLTIFMGSPIYEQCCTTQFL